MKKYFFSIALILACNSGLASTNASSQQVIVVDCGSTGTRIHLFQKNNDSISEPIKKNKVIPGLSSFIDDADSATQPLGVDATAIKTSMDNLVDTWQHNGINIGPTTPIIVYGTAGLRLVRQDAANLAIQTAANELKSHLGLTSTPTSTVITGNQEGLYDWIGVNLTQTPTTNSSSTHGVLDLGGASVEIAFNANNATPSESTFHMKVYTRTYPHAQYHIVTQSLLGEGQDAALASMNGDIPSNRAVCYPAGIWSDEAVGEPRDGTNPPVNYNFAACQNNANKFFVDNQINKQLSAIHTIMSEQPSIDWLAISGFQYTADFFKAQSVSELEQNASNDNGISWDTLKGQYPDQPQPFLQKYFFSAAYSTELLKTMLNTTPDPDVSFASGADWTNGVAYDYFFSQTH